MPAAVARRFHYLPLDLGLADAARIAAGRSWAELLVLRPGATLLERDGSSVLLGALARAGADARTLVALSSAGLFVLFALAPLPWRRPEAWLGAMLVGALSLPDWLAAHLLSGRPALASAAALAFVLSAWRTPGPRRWRHRLATAAAMAGAIWLAGGSLLWALPAAALALGGRRRDALELLGCAAAAAALAAALTLEPGLALRNQSGWRALADAASNGEPLPTAGVLLAALALISLARWQVTGAPWDRREDLPLLALAAMGAAGGLLAPPIAEDWALPALLLLAASMLQAIAEVELARGPRRATVAGFTGLALFLALSSDLQGRWSEPEPCAHLETPEAAALWPEPGGVVYSPDVGALICGVFRFPRGAWRYARGPAPWAMREEDWSAVRAVVDQGYSEASFRPMIARMGAGDRLAVLASKRPELPALEWARVGSYTDLRVGLWMGKLRR